MQLKPMPSSPEMEVAPAKMFDGRFFLTNPFEFDYVCKWDGVEYEFPAMKTVPLLIETATPIQTQAIRRKFAGEIGTAAFMKSKDYAKLSGTEKQNKGSGIPTYVPLFKQDGTFNEASPIAPYVLKCLEPLPVVKAKVGRPRKSEKPLTTDPKTGKTVVTLLTHEQQDNFSLIEEASNARE